MQRKTKLIISWLFIGVWLVATSIYLFYWRFASYGPFDPQSVWLQRAPLTVDVADKTLLHVRDGCFCGLLADQHQQLLNQYPEYQQRRVTPATVEAMGIPVPATPMIVIVEQGLVIYAGPYATGPTCSTDNSFLPELLGEQRQLQPPWYNGNANACRCPQ